MQLKEFDIILDIKKYNKTDYFEVVQGDLNSNVLNITLVDGLNPYNLAGTNVEIVFAKPDGTTVIQDENNGVAIVNATEGRMTCTLNTNTIASPGKVVAEVRVLSDIDDMLLTSARFGFYVRRAIFGDDTIKSTNEWPLLKKLLEVSESEKLRETEELIRQSNEEERIQNEQTREDNELNRNINEEQRIVKETERINSENERIANEEIRRTNEQNRQSNEEIRIENEDIRISQEESRVLAEESRESNETIRQQNENERESNEVIRVSNEEERIQNESNRVSAEIDRVQAELDRQEGYNQAIDNFNTQGQQAINDFNTQGQQAINDFVTETERVEAIYPTRLTNVENDLAQHKLDYASQRQQDQLKLAKVEKDINDYKQVMSQVNINQEAKQNVSGYEVISLPKNAANGQVSTTVAGQTATNLAINGKGDSTEGWWKQDQVTVTEDGFYEIDTSGIVRARPRAKTFAGRKYLLTFVGQCISGTMWALQCYLSKGGSSNTDDPTSATVTILRLSDTELKRRYAILSPTDDGEAISIWRTDLGEGEPAKYHIKEIMLFDVTDMEGTDEEIFNEINTKFPHYFSGTKSTVSAIRLKSVGKNLFDKKLMKSNLVNIDGRQCVLTHDIVLPINKFKANMAYTIKYETKKQENFGRLRVVFTYADGTTDAFSVADYADWTTITRTSNQSKSLISITINNAGNGSSNRGYINLDNLQVEEGTVATPYEPYTESTQYLPNVGELRSLPNGTKDEVNLNERKLIKRVSNEYTINSDLIQQVSALNYLEKATSFHLVLNIDNTVPSRTTPSNDNAYFVQKGIKFSPLDAWGPGSINWDKDFPQYHIFPELYNGRMRLTVSLPHTLTGWEGIPTVQQVRDYFDANPATLTYQLAEPVEIPIEVSGNIVSYPSGTIYIERAVPDAGIYTDKMTVLHQDLPIKVLEKLSKIDFTTGLETELDVSDAVIAENKLSFTHPDLVDGDIVFFTYEYDRESTEGETEIEYYDSRYVIKDSVTGKFYKWHIAVADGVPSIELTEV